LLFGIARKHVDQNAACAIALIWMVHPLVTEPVDYISQRTELMMATFFLATLYFGGSRATMSVICCALGMACKETMVVAPIVVLLYDRTFAFGSFREALQRRGRYYAALSATWLVLVVLLWTSPRGDSAGFTGASVSAWSYLLDQSAMIVRYLRLAFWPRGLVLDYGEPPHVTFGEVAPYVLAVAALLAGTVVALVRNSAVGFLGAWFFLTLAPTSSIMPISTEVGAERRMYLPLMAIVALVLPPVARAFMARAPFYLAGGLVAVLLSIATIQRNAEYRSGLTLWQTVLDRWPPHARAHRNLAAELKLANRRDEEIEHLRAAVTALPELRNVLAVELLALGRHMEAADEFRIYLRDHPRDADAWSNVGNALDALGRSDEALDAFRRAVDVDPNNGLSQRNLALQYLQKNDFDNAVAHAREGARLTPTDPDAHNLLGLALIGQQQFDEAIAEFRTSLQLRPTNNDASGYLERTMKALGR
jgi:Flp pilus assembly protein TadD